ncbi:MAG: histidine--tRNA ligase [Bacilli bacterium]|nr:histidine--tRNA ligase [Bacilli bacterium]
MCITKEHGTYDLFGNESIKWQYVEKIITEVCQKYNFKYIRTPILEKTELFHKSIGKATDIISKELYNFKDKGNYNISLRPEGTSGIIRSYIENEMYKDNEITKLYYLGPMFRYEQLDEGRFREFYQFGVEVINSNDPLMDAQIINLALTIFKRLNIDVTVYINNVGEYENKKLYKESLKRYFKNHIDDLCDDCKRRYKQNPIRILDCKKDKRKDYVLGAPKIEKYLSSNSKEHFKKVLEYLEKLNIKYVINPNLVRGLDYYTNTVFEIKTNIDKLGCANTICGGGRYNSLINYLSDKNIPSIGFAIGIERLLNVVDSTLINNDNLVDVLIIGNKKNDKEKLLLSNFCIQNNLSVELSSNKCKSRYTINIIDNANYLMYDNIKNKKYNYNYDKLLKKLSLIT